MPITMDDLIGLNVTQLHDMPVVLTEADAQALLGGVGAEASSPRLVAAGMRHSQGGHTALLNGRMLITEAMRQVSYDAVSKTVTAEAGATWAQIHHTLVRHDRAPLVHQSSGHFTVGGSLAVNCHGRDPSQGPLVSTVVAVDLLCGDGTVITANPTNEHRDLFCAVIGGYGCAALILRATFRTTRNLALQEIWGKGDASKYAKILAALPGRRSADGVSTLHFGWLCCVPGKNFLNEVAYADYVEISGGYYEMALRDEAWGTSELLRAAWSAAIQDPQFHAALWEEIKALPLNGSHVSMNHRINWMRAPVSFTASRGHPERAGSDRVEMLQEYFVPICNFEPMLVAMRKQLQPGNAAGVRLLTCTARLVQSEMESCRTALSYASGKRVCLALEASVPLECAFSARAPTAPAADIFTRLISTALDLGGQFYLPYYRFATSTQVQQAYGGGIAALRAVIQRYDPERKFDNEFLRYLGV